MENKKAWLRIMEAVIGIMIVTGVLLVAYSQKTERADISDYVYDLQSRILCDIAVDADLRNKTLNYKGDIDIAPQEIIDFVELNLPNNLDFAIRVCEINLSCNLQNQIQKNIFAEERVISSNLEIYSPKKLKLFVWEK